MKDLATILSDYESYLYTGPETETRLVVLAADHDPAQFMPKLPARWVEAIRSMETVRTPPAHRKDLFMIRGPDPERFFNGLWAMHRYFYGER